MNGSVQTHNKTFPSSLAVPAALTLVLLSVMMAPGALAKEATFRARISPDEVEFGEVFNIIINVERDPDDAVTFPNPIPQNDKTRPVQSPARRIENPDAARVKETLTIPMLALDFEEVMTPAFVLKSRTGGALEVDAMSVNVKAPAEKEKATNAAAGKAPGQGTLGGAGATPFEPELAKDFAYTAQDDWRPLWALLIALTLVAVAFIIRKVLRIRSERPLPEAPPAPVVVVPAADLALQRLDALEGEGLLAKGEVSPFVTRLMNDVLRFYIGKRFGVRAEQSTTRELAELWLTQEPEGVDAATLRRILDDADMVKFARAEMQQDVAQKSAEKVRAFIELHREDLKDPESLEEGAA